MDLVFFLLPASLVPATIAVIGFIWSVKTGQLEDLDAPANRILFDDDTPSHPK